MDWEIHPLTILRGAAAINSLTLWSEQQGREREDEVKEDREDFNAHQLAALRFQDFDAETLTEASADKISVLTLDFDLFVCY